MSAPADILEPLVAWIAAYRAAGHDPWTMQRAFLAAFPGSDASRYAAALVRSNRQRVARV